MIEGNGKFDLVGRHGFISSVGFGDVFISIISLCVDSSCGSLFHKRCLAIALHIRTVETLCPIKDISVDSCLVPIASGLEDIHALV